jgi:hypothetical protein
MVEALRHDSSLRAAVSGAGIVMISTGLNDLDQSQALDKAARHECGGPANENCFRAVATRWRANFDAALSEVARLRRDKPTAVRLVTAQNIFLSDPSIAVDYHLSTGFAKTGGALITRLLRDVMCASAARHHAICVDAGPILNGPALDKPCDENTPGSHQAIADALVTTGLDELRDRPASSSS